MKLISVCVATAMAMAALADMVLAGELHEASKRGDLYKVEQVLAEGVDLNGRAANGETALVLAILHRRTGTAELLIEHGADIQGRTARGFTPLHAAAYAGATRTANLLLDEGAAIDDKDNKDGVAPLIIAIEEQRHDIAKLLIARGADIHITERYGHTALSKAVFSGNHQMAEVLKKMGADCQPEDLMGPFFHPICVEIGE